MGPGVRKAGAGRPRVTAVLSSVGSREVTLGVLLLVIGDGVVSGMDWTGLIPINAGGIRTGGL